MIEELLLVETRNTVPYENIACEKYLMDHVKPGQWILYLWQNANTVVIGRNQSALGEVRVSELEAAGGHLARRLSGGGAVYHDLGNLNFTFVARRADYNVALQTEVILQAVRALGIPAERTGRNDLTADDRKFSGHAYYASGDSCYHHGTLMVNVALDEMGRYLKPAPDKLAAKGVQSVRSRVVNLSEFRKGLSVADVAASLRTAFGEAFGLPVQEVSIDSFNQEEISASTRHFQSREWLMRDELDFGTYAHARFPWGDATIRYTVENDRIDECTFSSDGLEADYLSAIPGLLYLVPNNRAAVEAALMEAADEPALAAIATDIAALMYPGEEAAA